MFVCEELSLGLSNNAAEIRMNVVDLINTEQFQSMGTRVTYTANLLEE